MIIAAHCLPEMPTAMSFSLIEVWGRFCVATIGADIHPASPGGSPLRCRGIGTQLDREIVLLPFLWVRIR